MKQAEEAKRNAQSSARALLDEYRPLKHDVDLMRTELLGIEKLPDLPQSDKERMGSIGYVCFSLVFLSFCFLALSSPD